MGFTQQETTCDVCHEPCTQSLSCEHRLCIECILRLEDNFKVSCPTCKKVTDTETMLFSCYKCPRCSSFNSEFFLCKKCDNYLCAPCWDIVHSFYPANQHIKDDKDETQQRIVYDHLHKVKYLDVKIKRKLIQLENSEAPTSLRQAQINQIQSHFNLLRDELTKQETAAIQHVHEIADNEIKKLEQQGKEITTYTTRCTNAFFDKHASLLQDLPTVNESIDFALSLNQEYQIPSIVTVRHEPILHDLITKSGKFTPKITGSALVVCVGGGAGGGQGGTQYRGGGGSGYITVTRKFLSVFDTVEVEIGAGGKNVTSGAPAQDGFATKFGDIVAQDGTASKSVKEVGSGGSGGGSGSCCYNPCFSGGQGGSGGSNGKIGVPWNFAGKGYCAEEFELIKPYGILPGAGGNGGVYTSSNNPSGGGAGGVIFGDVFIKADDGTGEINQGQGQGGIGYGAGGGGGAYVLGSNPDSKFGGQGAPGCIIVIYE